LVSPQLTDEGDTYMRLSRNSSGSSLASSIVRGSLGYFIAITVVGILIRVYLMFSPVTLLESIIKYNTSVMYPLQRILESSLGVIHLRVLGIFLYVLSVIIIWFLIYDETISKLIMSSFISLEPHLLLYSIFNISYFIPLVIFLAVYGISKKLPASNTKALMVGMLIGFSAVFSPHVLFYLSLMYMVKALTSLQSLVNVRSYIERLKDVHEKLGRVRGYLNVTKNEELKRKLESSEKKLVEISSKYTEEALGRIESVLSLVSPYSIMTLTFLIITAVLISISFGVENTVKSLLWFPMYFLGDLKGILSIGSASFVRVLMYSPVILMAIYFVLFGECKSEHALSFILLLLLPLNPYIGVEDLLIPLYMMFDVITLNIEPLKEALSRVSFRVVVIVLVVLSIYQLALVVYATPQGYEPITGGAFVDMSAVSRAFNYSLQSYQGYPMFYVKEDADAVKYYLVAEGYIVDPYGIIIVSKNASFVEENPLSYAYVGDVKYTVIHEWEFIKPSVYFTRHGIQPIRAVVAIKLGST